MKSVTSVIFDMDGVIVNTEPLHKKAYYKTFKSLGLTVSDELYHSLTGTSTINAFENLKQHFQLNESPQELVILKRAAFVDLFKNDPSLSLIDGVENIIHYFFKKNITMVLASSASMETINRVFDRFNLHQYFIDKLSGADLKQSKPHPEIFEKAVQTLKQPKQNCIVIEDSDNGVLAANNAGVFCVGYISEHSKQQSLKNADLIINNFEELKEFI